MHFFRRIGAFVFFLLLFPFHGYSEIQDGMLFRSYDVPAEQRTSLHLPGGPREWVTFTDSLTLSFSLKIELDKGRFGYICRLALDDLLPIDLLLYPHEDLPQICATADHRTIIPLNEDGDNVEEWKDYYVRIYEERDDLVVTANGREIFRGLYAASRHRLKVCFGKSDAPGMVSSDVAPMLLADLQLKVDRRRALSWLLSEEADLAPCSNVTIKACNHFFLKDLNRKWTPILSLEMPSVTHACFSPDKSRVYFISDGQVVQAEVASHRYQRYPYRRDMKFARVCDDFLVLPDSTLVYAAMDREEFIRFDADTHEWSADNTRSRTSLYLHHNTLQLDSTGQVLQLFGYGQHRYSNEAFFWDPAKAGVVRQVWSDIPPRYLAAAGVKDGKVYVLGGKGNTEGRQELGVRFFDSFLEIDPADGSARPMWSSELMTHNVGAKDLVFEKDGDSFLVLTYDPEIQESALQLRRFRFEDGTSEALADALPYSFSDISSEARLGYNEEEEFYLATLCWKDAAAKYHAALYMLGAPILSPCAAFRAPGMPDWAWWAIGAACILALLSGLLILRKHRRTAADEAFPEEISNLALPKKPGVYLLGGFHVLDKECNDIASSFSPILVQLLSILALNTAERGGISNAKLKSMLWPDKSDESFNNNKGVNLNRLRGLLEQVGGLSIVSDGGNWKLIDEAQHCDCLVAKQRLAEGNIEQILRVASWGPLLPEYQFDWLDPYKSRYTDLVFSRLDEIVASGVSAEQRVKIADCRLLFDSLDEEGVLLKCQALVSLGKVGAAQSVFARFVNEYERVMQEKFDKDFALFIKK